MSTEVEQAVVVETTEAVAPASEAAVVLDTSEASAVSEVAVNGTESLAQPMPETPQVTSEEAQPAPEAAQEATPEAVQEATPEVAQEAAPQVAQEAAPEAVQEAAPQEAAQEAAPEVAQEAAPEAAQEAAQEDQGAKRKRRRRKRGGRKGRPLDAFNPGDELEGVVRSVQPYGAFIDVGAERDGLIHISELRDGFVEKVEDVIKEGDKVSVRVKEVQVEQGRLSLTMRNPESERESSREPKKKRMRLKELEEGDEYTGSVSSIVDFGAFVDIGAVTDGLVHISEISEDRVNNVSDLLSEGQEVKVRILGVDKKRKRISLTMREKQAIEEKYLRPSQDSGRYTTGGSGSRSGNSGNGNGNRNRNRQNDSADINLNSEELPSMMQLAFARAQARKKKSSKKEPSQDNTLDDIITRMLAE